MNVKFKMVLLLLLSQHLSTLVNLPDSAFRAAKPVRRAQDDGTLEAQAAVEVGGEPVEEVYADELPAEGEAVEEVPAEGEAFAEEAAPEEYYEPNYEEPEEPQLEDEEQILDVNFEAEEIQETLAMIEYKMTEVNELMKECIEEEFAADLMADKDQIMTECVGLTYQILFFNFQESMRRVKQIFIELLKEKLSHLSEHYLDETEFFLDLLEDFVDKDFLLRESLEISKNTSKYYVSPRFFDSLIDIAQPEIDAFHELHDRLRKSRTEIQDLMDEKLREREKYLDSLKGEVEQFENVMEPEPEPVYAEPEEIYDGDEGQEGEEMEEEAYEEPEEEEPEEEEGAEYEEEELPHQALGDGDDGGAGEGLAEAAADGEAEGGAGGAGDSEGGAGEGASEAEPGVQSKLAAPEGGEERLRKMIRKVYRRPYKAI